MVFANSLLGAWHLGEVVENKPASLLVVSLGKALNRMLPPLCGRQVAQMATPKRVQKSSLKYSDTIRFLVNGGKIWQNIKKILSSYMSDHHMVHTILPTITDKLFWFKLFTHFSLSSSDFCLG